ncbi:MAG: hypothetical protein P8130_03530 [Deltaproteobacteria bacterium]
MIEQMMGTIFQTTAAWVLGAIIVSAIAVSILFYLQLAVFLIGGIAISVFRNFVEKFNHWKMVRTTNELSWKGAQLGITMPDGGEPVAEEKQKKES